MRWLTGTLGTTAERRGSWRTAWALMRCSCGAHASSTASSNTPCWPCTPCSPCTWRHVPSLQSLLTPCCYLSGREEEFDCVAPDQLRGFQPRVHLTPCSSPLLLAHTHAHTIKQRKRPHYHHHSHTHTVAVAPTVNGGERGGRTAPVVGGECAECGGGCFRCRARPPGAGDGRRGRCRGRHRGEPGARLAAAGGRHLLRRMLCLLLLTRFFCSACFS